MRREANRTNRALSKVGKDLKTFGKRAKMAAIGVGALGAAFAALQVAKSIKDFKDFEQNMRSIQALTGATTESLKELEAAALSAAERTRFDTRQTSESLLGLARAGLSAKESMEALNPILDLTEVAQGDLVGVTETMLATLKAWGKPAKDAAAIADIFTNSLSNSAMNAERLQGAVTNAAAISSSFNQEIDTTVAVLSVMTDQLLDGHVAGTALQGTWVRMMDVAKQFNIEVKKENGEIKDLIELLKEFEAKGISAADAFDVFGARGGKGIAIMLNKGTAAMEEMKLKLQETGTTSEKAAMQMDTTSGQLARLASVSQSTRVRLGKIIQPALTKFLESMIQGVQRFSLYMQENREAIVQFADSVLTKLAGALKFIAENFETIINLTKAYIALKFGLYMTNLIPILLNAQRAFSVLALGQAHATATAAAYNAAVSRLTLALPLYAVAAWGIVHVGNKMIDVMNEGSKIQQRNIESVNESKRAYSEWLNVLKEVKTGLRVLAIEDVAAAEKARDAMTKEITAKEKQIASLREQAKAPGGRGTFKSRKAGKALEEEKAALLDLVAARDKLDRSILNNIGRTKTFTDGTDNSTTAADAAAMAAEELSNKIAEMSLEMEHAALIAEQERIMITGNSEARREAALQIERLNIAKKLGVDVTNEAIQALLAENDALANQKRLTELLKKAKDDLKDSHPVQPGGPIDPKDVKPLPIKPFEPDFEKDLKDRGKAAREAREAAEKVAESYQKIFDNFMEGVQKRFADTFVNMFDEGIGSWKDFFGSIGDMFKDMLAEMLAAWLQNQLMMGGKGGGGLGSLFGGAGGGTGGAPGAMSGGGGGGFMDMFGGLFGGGGGGSTPLPADQAGPPAPGGGGGGMGAAAGVMGGIGFGMMMEGFIGAGDQYDYSEVGNMVGTGLGTGIGMAFGGPVGAMVGGAIGGALGSLIGKQFKKPKPKMEADLKLGVDGMMEAAFSKSGPVVEAMEEHMTEMGDGLAGAINGFVASLGGTAESMAGEIQFAMEDKFYRVIVDGVTHKFGEDLQAAVEFAMRTAFEKLTITDVSGDLVDAVGEFDQFLYEAEQLGIDLAAVAQKGATGLLDARLQIEQHKGSILEDMTGLMEKAGMNTNAIAGQRAQIEQMIFQVSVAKLEAELIAFGMMNDQMQSIVNGLKAFAAESKNFQGLAKSQRKINKKAKKAERARAKEAIIDELLQSELSDFEYQLLKLNQHWDSLAKQAKKLGISEERVAAAREKAMEELRTQFLQPLLDLKDQILSGPTVLPGAQFASLRDQFAEAKARLDSGDLTAAGDVADIGGELLALAGQLWGTSSAAYQALVDEILGTIEGAEGGEATVPIEEEMLDLAATTATYAQATYSAVQNVQDEVIKQNKKNREETEQIKKHTKHTFEEVEQSRVLQEEMNDLWKVWLQV